MGQSDIVYIEWVDSKGPRRWEYVDEAEPQPPSVLHAVGFLVDDNREYKTLAIFEGGGQVFGRTTIPAGCIRHMEVLRPKRRPK